MRFLNEFFFAVFSISSKRIGTGFRQAMIKPRSKFQDLATVWFYTAIVLIAMSGWLWLLGWVSWKIIAWVLGE
jgi:hypothetical protein